MRLGIISDVHADLHALRDALHQIERLGCSLIVCAGDIVDYGLFPGETIALLRQRRVPCIRGNHDRWAVGRGRAEEPEGGDADSDAADATGWDLSAADVRFLSSLPTRWDATLEGVRVAVRHGSPRSDMEGIMPDSTTPEDAHSWLQAVAAGVLVVGHTHRPFALSTLKGGLIVNPGALLRDPADDFREAAYVLDDRGKWVREAGLPCPGTFGILDLPSKRFTVHRAADGVEVEILRTTLGVCDKRRAQP